MKAESCPEDDVFDHESDEDGFAMFVTQRVSDHLRRVLHVYSVD